VGAVPAGLLLGFLSVSDEAYFEHGMSLLTIDRVQARVWDTLLGAAFTLGIAGAVFALGRWSLGVGPRGVGLGVLVVALAGVFFATGLNTDGKYWWRALPAADRVLILVGIALAAERTLLPGRIGLLPRRVPLFLAVVFLLVPVGLSAAAGSMRSDRVEEARGRPNFLFLVVDALRADHMGIHGYERNTTPFLDGLARGGYLFPNTVSNSLATRYTVPSIFTMVYPGVHGIREHGQVLSAEFVTLAEHLKEAGWATAAWAPNPNLKSQFRYGQGFDHYDDDILNEDPDLPVWEQYETAKRINGRALRWIREREGDPWFIYIHYREPHFPYAPPPDWDGMFYEPRPDGKPHRPITEEEYARQPGVMIDGDDRNDLEYYVAQYDANIRYCDDQIAAFLRTLREEGRLDDTVIVVSADHGEGFLEHGYWNHGNVIYDEACHVPGIVRMPEAVDGPVTIDAPVHTFDFSRTILDVAGVAPRTDVLQARSLLPLIRGGGEPPWEYAFVEKKNRSALRGRRWKYRACA